LGEKLIQSKNFALLLDFEPYVILVSLILLAWAFYKVFLREASSERHKNLRGHFSNLMRHFTAMSLGFIVFHILEQAPETSGLWRALPYVGLATLLMGMIVFVKTCRLIILQYLFLGSMKHGVPVLIVNIFSLLLSLVLAFWIAASIFGIELTPLLATSAAFSVIFGLALQDTLGNLFAGISLQIDKAFDIGDWLEISNGTLKTVGQVKEISWRATMLIGWTDEVITLPNRLLANSLIANFSLTEQPVVRSQIFKLKLESNMALAKQCLLESIKEVSSVRTWPEPLVLVSETTESWLSLKLVYYIDNYGSQYMVADAVISNALRYLQANGIEVAAPRLEIISPSASPSPAPR
jgi:small-conductance mechanosensitive channel